MKFLPSGDSVYRGDYGAGEAHRDAYAAQQMLTAWPSGASYGNPVVGALIQGGVGLASMGVGMAAQGKQRKSEQAHEKKMSGKQRKLLEAEAELASQQAAALAAQPIPPNLALYGAVVLVLLGGIGFSAWYIARRPKQDV